MNVWTIWLLLWNMLATAPGCQCDSQQGRKPCRCGKGGA